MKKSKIILWSVCILFLVPPISYSIFYYVLKKSGCIHTYLRDEASYSIFVIIKTGNEKRSEQIFRFMKPMIYLDGYAQRVFSPAWSYPNIIGMKRNVDKDENDRKTEKEIDAFFDASIGENVTQLRTFLLSGKGEDFLQFCQTKKIPIIHNRDAIGNVQKPMIQQHYFYCESRHYSSGFKNLVLKVTFDPENSLKQLVFYIKNDSQLSIEGIDVSIENEPLLPNTYPVSIRDSSQSSSCSILTESPP